MIEHYKMYSTSFLSMHKETSGYSILGVNLSSLCSLNHTESSIVGHSEGICFLTSGAKFRVPLKYIG